MRTSLSSKGQSKVIGIVIVIIAIFIGAIAILYTFYITEPPTLTELEDPEGDAGFIGDPGIIDITSAKMEVNEEELKITINVRDYVPEYLNDGEYAQWLAMVIILQEGEIRAYEVYMEMNSTTGQGELVGYFRELGEQEESCTVEYDGNSLTIFAPLEELQSAKEIQYYIEAAFEEWSGDELLTYGIDYAPDEGFQSFQP